jgi:hypothetical protein
MKLSKVNVSKIQMGFSWELIIEICHFFRFGDWKKELHVIDIMQHQDVEAHDIWSLAQS